MSRVLIASDIHLHRWHNFGYHTGTLLPKRLFDQQQVLNQILKIIQENNVKVFINGGDLFHSVGNIPVEALNIAHSFYNTLDKEGVTCCFVTGNHDLIKRESPEWFHVSTNVFDKIAVMQNLGFKCKLIGFEEKVDYNEVKGYDIVVVHQTPIGARVGNFVFGEGVNWKALATQNKLVFFGHIHQRGQLAANCYVIGSPMHLNFGDAGQRGVYIVDTETSTVDFWPLVYPEFRTVTSADEIKDTFNYYRLLGVDKKAEGENVVSVLAPKVFEERIKSEDFEAILSEWLVLNNKPSDYRKILTPLLTSKSNLGQKVYKGRVISVAIKDFISIGEIIYKFQDGFTSIAGPNGNGKTAFVDAIFWCLFGETTKGLTGDDVIRRGQDDCHVQLILNEGTTNIRIQRTRKDGLRLSTSNESGVTDTGDAIIKSVLDGMKQVDRQKYLEDILGFNKIVFLSSCYFSQENVKTITGLSDTEKTNMITNLLGFETYDDLYDEIGDQIDKHGEDIDAFVEQKKDIESQIEKCKSEVIIFNNELGSLKTWVDKQKENISQFKAEITELKSQKIEESAVVIVDYDSKLQELSKKEDELMEFVDSSENEIDSLQADKEQLSLKMSKLGQECGFITVQVEELTTEILALENAQLGERCNKCGSVIEKENIAIFIADKEREIKDLKDKSHAMKQELNGFSENFAGMVKDINIVKADKDSYTKSLREIRSKREQTLDSKKDQDAKVKASALKAVGVEAQIDKQLSLIKEAKNNLADMEKRIEDLIEKRDRINDKILELDDAGFKIDIILGQANKDIEVLEFWKTAFSAKGIRGLLLDRFCNQFNTIVNDYLSKASNGEMSIVLNPVKVLKSGEDRNKLSLDINMDGTPVTYTSMSGGEKRRVDVSLCLALNKWLSNRCGLTHGLLGLIIFDELFSFLDREGEENIGELLYDEGGDKIILVISHTPELSSYAKNMISISKVDGISSLVD
jgi:DNA repair exonuclease SbcCD ATPase subunit